MAASKMTEGADIRVGQSSEMAGIEQTGEVLAARSLQDEAGTLATQEKSDG